MKKILLFFMLLVISSCNKSNRNNNFINEEVEYCCPECIIYIQPFDNFTKKEVIKIVPELQKQFDHWLYGRWEFKVLDPIQLPIKSKALGCDKYKAITILNFLSNKNLKNNEIIIGLTHKDICAHVHGVQNYGIVGLSFSPGNVCVVSDKRLKNKSIFWKPILHEFMHAFYGAKHCKNDDPTCFMVDARGHGTFNIQDKLCDSCNKQ